MAATTVRAPIDTAFQKGNFLDFTFMGAKLAGASAETLNLLRKHLVL
jgi:hypothetical protein